MWDILIQNLPTVILLIIVGIICGADLIKAIAVWKKERSDRIGKQVEKKQKENDLNTTLLNFQNSLEQINKKLDDQDKRFSEMENKIKDLTESDMHDIKSWIVDQYHRFYVHQGWIDAFSADTIDHRYNDYKKEGGNSYIDALMNQLHSLPMDPKLGIHNNKDK